MKENQITMAVETITPEIAKAYLDTSKGNRNLSKVYVRRYADIMKNGKWLLNGEAVVFDWDGSLRQGHHRMEAVKKADRAVQFCVIRGVDPAVFTTFDCGRTRNAGQVLSCIGTPNYNAVAALIKGLSILRDGRPLGENISGQARLTNDEVLNRYLPNREMYDVFAKSARAIAERGEAKRMLDASLVGSCMAYLVIDGGYEYEFVSDFFRSVCSYDTSPNDSIELLRKRLLAERDKKTSNLPATHRFVFLVKTWNDYVTGAPRTILTYHKDKETVPTFILND